MTDSVQIELMNNSLTNEAARAYFNELSYHFDLTIKDIVRAITTTRIDLAEAIIRILVKEYGISPNQLVIEERLGAITTDYRNSISIKIDMDKPKLEPLTPMTMPEQARNDRFDYLGM